MLRENPKESGQENMFRLKLSSIIDLRHELVKLSQMVDWEGLRADLSGYYCTEFGATGSRFA